MANGKGGSEMPRGPEGEGRPADVIGNAVHVMKIATGEIEERAELRSAAAELGGSVAGHVQKSSLSGSERKSP